MRLADRLGTWKSAWSWPEWPRLHAELGRRRFEIGLSVRVTVAALLSLAAAQFLSFGLPLWAVMTSIVVTQMSVGSSLKATLDYFVGTLGGAVYGGLVAMLLPHPNEIALLAVLAIALGPLALLAAIRPSLKIAPITAVIVLLVPEMSHTSPLASDIDRVLEVALGGVIGLLVSSLVFPSSACLQASEEAARILDRMAQALTAIFAGMASGLDNAALHRAQDGIGQGMGQLAAIAAEAERERTAGLAMAPATGPLVRTLLRLRHDLVMIGRAAAAPLPSILAEPLHVPLDRVSQAVAGYLNRSGAALRTHAKAPSAEAMKSALEFYATETAKMRQQGLTRGLPGEVIERFFALGFALEQMSQNIGDLERCITEWAGEPKGRS